MSAPSSGSTGCVVGPMTSPVGLVLVTLPDGDVPGAVLGSPIVGSPMLGSSIGGRFRPPSCLHSGSSGVVAQSSSSSASDRPPGRPGGDDFPKALQIALTFPFVDAVVGQNRQQALDLHMGDYTNLSVTLEVDLTQGMPTNPTDVLPTELDPGQLLQNALDCIASGNLASAACQKVLNSPEALLKLKQICQEPANTGKLVCVALNQVPGLPGLNSTEAGGDPLTQLGDQVGTVLDGLGLGRSGTGPWNDKAHGGPTMAQLQAVYDPSLVNLLVPQLVTSSSGSTKGGEGQ